jgi:hypothetical protein
MQSIKKLSTAIALVALSMAIGVASVRASPETPRLGTTPLAPLISTLLNVANTIGNDQFSTVDLTTSVDPSTTSTQHYGPYASGSSDSSTCGNDWAQDTFNRHFTIFFAKGSIVIVEQFRDGSFITPAQDQPQAKWSPGGCQNSPIPQGTVSDGVIGAMHGYFIIPLPPGQTQISHSPFCNAVGGTNTNCTTTSFVDSHFAPGCGPGVSCPDIVTTFFFHYTAPITSTAPNSGLIKNEWKNASADRGGNSGDIRSFNTV